MSKTFKGFPDELVDFLRELSSNNNREWFNANKERYKSSIVKPVCEFIEAFAPRLEKISPHFVADPRPHGGSMFRIYRDTRFSKNKRPYKLNVGCQFRHTAGKDAHAPGFYVHLSPDEVFFCAGIWKPSNEVLDKIRLTIVEKPAKWGALLNDKKLNKYIDKLAGDSLKRPPRGYPSDHPFIDDLKRKSFIMVRNVDPEMIHSSRFIDEVEKTFIAASPMMRFLTVATGQRY